MFWLPSRESLRVAAFDSEMLLQETSTDWMDSFILRNSARASQNMLPKELELRPRVSRPELLFSRSMQSLEPALSSSLLRDRSSAMRDLLTLRAWARKRDPSYEI